MQKTLKSGFKLLGGRGTGIYLSTRYS